MNATTDPRLTAWSARIEDMPRDRHHQLEHLIRFAILAPSTHNSQPWRFRVRKDGIEVHADYRRWLRVVDPERRELHVSVGCALEALLLAADYAGFKTELQPCQSDHEDDDECMAFVKVSNGGITGPLSHRLFPAIAARHTDHGPFFLMNLSDAHLAALREAAALPGVALALTQDDAQRNLLRDLTARADAARFANPEYRRELGYWMREGAYDESWFVARLQQMATALLDRGEAHAREDAWLIEKSASFGVIATTTDSHEARVDAGRAFMRLALTAQTLGMAVQPMNQVLEDRYFRGQLLDTLFADQIKSPTPFAHNPDDAPPTPQIAFRIGYAQATSRPTPRRPLEEFLLN